jgi:hypothetical protein
MNIKCIKDLKLIQLNSVLELEKYCERKDIGSFLRTRLDSTQPLDEKIKKNFLFPLGLVDKENNITEQGKECVESNRVWLKEKGEYTLTQIIDPLYSKIIDISPLDSRNIKDHDEVGEPTKYNILSEEIISFKNIDNRYKTLNKNCSYFTYKELDRSLKLNWELSLDKGDVITLKDVNYGLDSDLKFKDTKGFDINLFLEEVSEKNNFYWNNELKALEISCEYASKNEGIDFSIKNLEIEEKNLDICNERIEFEEIRIENISVMPNSEEEAKKWYYNKLFRFASDTYRKPSEFNQYNRSQLESKYMRSYLKGSMDIKEFLNYSKNLGQEDSKAYWNIQAPLDLSFEAERITPSDELIIGRIGEKLTINKIISKIKEDKIIDSLILFDQHILTDSNISKDYLKYKYKFLSKFLSAVGINTPLEVYTKRTSLINLDSIDVHHKNIKFYDNKSLDRHPRNLIFIYKDGSYGIWRVDRTIDIIIYSTNDFTEDTIGESRNFSIQKVNINTLDDFSRSIVEGRLA